MAYSIFCETNKYQELYDFLCIHYMTPKDLFNLKTEASQLTTNLVYYEKYKNKIIGFDYSSWIEDLE